jgi:hypothetical protein
MAKDLSQLVADFYSYFLDLYHQNMPPPDPGVRSDGQTVPAAQPAPGAAPARAFIAFASIGTPITPEMFKLQSGDFDRGLVLQQTTLCANIIPVIDGTSILAPGLLKVDTAYELMLEEAQPLTALDMEAFGHVKSSAQKVFENAKGNYSLPGLNGEFHPAIPSPSDWPLPTGATAWTSKSFAQSETVVVAVPPPPAPPPAPVNPMPNSPPGMPGMPPGFIPGNI